MSGLLRRFGLAFSLSAVLWISLAPALILDVKRMVYHSAQPLVTCAAGLLIDILLFGLALGLIDWWVRRLHRAWCSRALTAVTITVALFGMVRLAAVELHWFRGPRVWLCTFLMSVISLVLLAIRHPSSFERLTRVARVLEPGVLALGLGLFLQIGWALYVTSRMPPEQHGWRQTRAQLRTRPRRRVVWLLFDELSYRQLFEARDLNGLSLPAFDRLRAQSTSFRDVSPPGYFTETAVLSLFYGRRVEALRAENKQSIAVRFVGNSEWRPSKPEETVFGDVRSAGGTAAIVGWYNPYCDLLGASVMRCFWTDAGPLFPGVSAHNSAWRNALLLPATLLRTRFLRLSQQKLPDRPGSAERIASYVALLQHSIEVAGDPAEALCFLHLPLPHEPGIYDRQRQAFTATGGTYLDNVALADRALDQIMSSVERSPAAQETALIVSSDHSWRTAEWVTEPYWTQEEARASGNRFDPRIPFLVHFPAEQRGHEITRPFDALNTRALIDGILQRRISNGDELRAWAEHQ